MVRAWSAARRGMPLVVLGEYGDPRNAYQRTVRAEAGPEVRFPGAIYDAPAVAALRAHARLYLHGHTVGGTNPSLVEALGAGSPVLAHDNPFNRWVAADAARYFAGERHCRDVLDVLLADEPALRAMRAAALDRHAEAFTWDAVLPQYERLLIDVTDAGS
jgi:glycosyltransferase involved in cell wall biosynthesis